MTEAASMEHVSAVADRPYLKAFLLDEPTREAVEKVSTELMIPHAAVRRGGIREAIAQLGESRSPRLLVVDISDRDLPLSDINELAEVCEPGVRVIAVGNRNDVGLFRDLMNSGVADYLVKPLTTQLLHRSLLNAVEGASPARQTSRLGRLVSIIGSRGGVGTTTIATSCGWVIANRRHRRAALVDLDLQFGTAALSLDLESSTRPSRGSRAVEQDRQSLPRALDGASQRFLPPPRRRGEPRGRARARPIRPRGPDQRASRQVSLRPHGRPPARRTPQRAALEQSSNVVLVTDLSVAGMRDTLRLIQLLSATNAGCGVLIVVNRLGEHKDRMLRITDFEKGIGRPVDVTIPFQRRQLAHAIDAGEPAASRCQARGARRGRDRDGALWRACEAAAAPAASLLVGSAARVRTQVDDRSGDRAVGLPQARPRMPRRRASLPPLQSRGSHRRAGPLARSGAAPTQREPPSPRFKRTCTSASSRPQPPSCRARSSTARSSRSSARSSPSVGSP